MSEGGCIENYIYAGSKSMVERGKAEPNEEHICNYNYVVCAENFVNFVSFCWPDDAQGALVGSLYNILFIDYCK